MRKSRDPFEAVKSGDAGRVRELLAHDATFANTKDADGATPLHYATLGGHREVVELLLDSGADINARDDRFGATPTGWAIEYLRERGGLLGMEIEDVRHAIGENDVRWVRRFVTRLPSLAKATDARGKTLLQHATESGNQEITRLFVSEQQVT
jgi:ankyrin repeat protein